VSADGARPPAGYPADGYLAGLASEIIPRSARGFAGVGPVTAHELVQAGQTVVRAGLSLPIAVLHVGALDHNIATMRRWAAGRGAELAPHVKTTMAPWIMDRQLRAGAWALTVASCAQAQVCADLGAPRILIANEVVDPADMSWLAGRLRDPAGPRLISYADSVAGADLLADGLTRHGAVRPLDVLIEMGAAGGRAGCRTVVRALTVARQAARCPLLRIRGAGGFEGILAAGRTGPDLARVDAFCDQIHDLGDALLGAGLVDTADERLILSAAGSIYFDRVAARLSQPLASGQEPLVVLRSGGYVSHDHGYLARLSPLGGGQDAFRPALEVRARVISRPQDDLAIAGAGKRDLGTDIAMPIVAGCLAADGTPAGASADGLYVDGINDQHTYIRCRPGESLRGRLDVGGIVALGVSHPCTTFDRWQYVVAVDDQDQIVAVVRTVFG
jgi:D-serine deaminase-like pyridoxal phosphate-dependent protein